MIEVANLSKRYGRVTAIDGMTFQVAAGEIVGFLGPNGAGKTTTMRILTGFLTATGGTVHVGGLDVFSESLEVRRIIGYMPENLGLYPEMRVSEYLGYRGALKGLRGKTLRQRTDAVYEACGLGEVRRTLIGRLSKGYRQRVGLADSLLHEPRVLILDEPTIGLDPNQIRQIRHLIKGLAAAHTVLLSSHILHEVESVCDRVLIINRGRIVASDTPANLVGLMKGNTRVVAEVRGPRDEVLTRLEKLEGVVRVVCDEGGPWNRYYCECAKSVDVREPLFRAVLANGWELRELHAEQRNLEDVFVALTRETGASSEGEAA
jgi:ABC-2 type transport system ATP-binding protein